MSLVRERFFLLCAQIPTSITKGSATAAQGSHQGEAIDADQLGGPPCRVVTWEIILRSRSKRSFRLDCEHEKEAANLIRGVIRQSKRPTAALMVHTTSAPINGSFASVPTLFRSVQDIPKYVHAYTLTDLGTCVKRFRHKLLRENTPLEISDTTVMC